ncbi:MAG: hypothetical protein HYW25_02510 [Candidatus Aenigmarchaeota archaeon]|nr:hypothetical protein [Candidatus Aenigmarchaeota archaeon]
MSCIICGRSTRERILGTKRGMTVTYCSGHAIDCLAGGATCRMEILPF